MEKPWGESRPTEGRYEDPNGDPDEDHYRDSDEDLYEFPDEGPDDGPEPPPPIPGLVFVVTGGCGFLGRHLVRLLLEEEPDLRELRVFDLHLDPDLPDDPRVRALRGDVGDAGAVGRALEGADVVLHTAALVDVWGNADPQSIARVNVQGTKALLRGCRSAGVRCLIFTSSMEVVGPNERGDPFVRGDEETPYPTRHTQPYSLSKAQAERLVLDTNGVTVSGGGRLVTVALRPTGIYGEGHPLLELFYRRGKAMGGWLPRTLPPNCEHGRVYVGNVAWMHILAARAALLQPSSVGGRAFFCTDSSPYAPYDAFTALLLRPAGLRLAGPQIPRPILFFWAHLNAALWAFARRLPAPLRPAAAPLLLPHTAAAAATPFTAATAAARRRFGYRPRVAWRTARGRTAAWLRGLP